MELEVCTEPLAEGNCYLLAEDGGALVIDPNDPIGVPDRLNALGWTPELILLTHEHCDHTAGLEALRAQWPGVPTVASQACAAGLQSTRLNMSGMMEVYLTFKGKPGISYQPFVCATPEICYEHTWENDWRGHRLRCIALPGHTPGSAGIFLDEGFFFSGDYFIPGEPVILRLPGGSETDYQSRTVPILSRLPAGLCICPGHGAMYRLTHKELTAHGLC